MVFDSYVHSGSKQKWFSVVLFQFEPRESPRVAKPTMELAKFTHLGDAYTYAAGILDRLDGTTFRDWNRIVVR